MSQLPVVAFATLMAVLTLVGIVVGDGSPVMALGPMLLLICLYLCWKLPLRYPVLLLTFLALTLENPADVPACGLWKSPLYTVGALLLAHMNVTLPQRWMIFSGLDLVLAYLALVALARWIIRPVGTPASAPAGPMRMFSLLCLAATGWMWAWGMARGGADFASSLWQVQRVIYLPIMALLFQSTLHGAADGAAFGKVILLSACIKAAVAIYVRMTIPPPAGQEVLQYATTHADSMLFSIAFCLVVLLLVERVTRRRVLLAWLVLPLLCGGMVANNRRLVWVELIIGLLVVYAMSPPTKGKRTVKRLAFLSSPLALAYTVAGWGSNSSIFKPVRTLRSVVDSDADASTGWRDLENYNLIFTLRQNPLIGSGYGHGYIELIKLPDISQEYSLYRHIPHNSYLGLWAYGGLIGFSALWALLLVGIYLAARTLRHGQNPRERTTAFAVICVIVIYLVHCYGDMGLGTWTSVFLVGPALSFASQIAVTSGAWPTKAPAPVIEATPLAPAPRPYPSAKELTA